MTGAVLVTGAGGLLGAAAAADPRARGLPRSHLDITDPDAIARALDAHRPSAVLNCAAEARVDAAERDPAATARVNAVAPGLLAAACARAGVRCVHVSTDYVLAGPDVPGHRLQPGDPPAPRGVYAASKRAGEEAALAAGAVVVRVQWVYAWSGPGFFAGALARLRAGAPLRLVTDQVGVPSPAPWVAARLLDACAPGGPSGLFHLAPAGAATAWDWVALGAAVAGVSLRSAAPARRADFAGVPRPARSVLDASAFFAAFGGVAPSWEAALCASKPRAQP
jgi:dTDP-4-dehydrorhamnose reductase